MPPVTSDLGETIQEGFTGNLSLHQEAQLKGFYRRMFELAEQNVERSEQLDKAGGPKAAQTGTELESNTVSKNAPKDKDGAKKAAELQAVENAVAKYGGPYLRNAFWNAVQVDSPDMTILRFMRARNFDIDRAFGMAISCNQFRLDMNIDEIMFKGELGLKDVPGFLNQFRRGISYIEGNTDNNELPIYFIHVARHFTNAQKPETLQQFVLMAMEYCRYLYTPPTEKVVIVFDMAGFGLKNMDWNCVLFILKCLEAYYPECLQRIYIHGAPWIFKGIWSMLQPLLDPVVAAKIKFSTKADELEEYIPKSRFSKSMGGTLDWDWNYVEPVEGENDLLKETEICNQIKEELDVLVRKFEDTTREWVNTEGHSDELDYRRLVLTKQMRLKNFQLRPFTRATNIYQRVNVLRNDGTVTWTYPQLNGPTQSQTINERHNVPALIAWLRAHHEDTLENSVGGRFSPCMLIPNSYSHVEGVEAIKKAKKAPKPKERPSKKEADVPGAAAGAAGGAAAAGAAGAAVASQRKPKGDRSKPRRTQKADAGDGDGAGVDKPVKRPARVKRKPAPPVGQPIASESEKPVETRNVASEPALSETTPIAPAAGAGLTGGALAGGVAAMGLSSKRPSSVTSDASFASAEEFGHASQARQSPAAPPLDMDDDDDEVDEIEEERVAHTNPTHRSIVQEYDLDDDEMSVLSEDDDNEDALTPETVVVPSYAMGKVTYAQCQQSEAALREDLEVAHDAMELFLDSRMREAEKLASDGADHRLYRSVGTSLINCVKSLMTFEPNDMQVSMKCCKHTVMIADVLRKKPSRLYKFLPLTRSTPRLSSMTLLEQHAELVYAEATLIRAIMGIIYSGNTIGVVREAMSLRTAYGIMRDLLQQLEEADGLVEEANILGHGAARTMDQDLRSGIYLGNALCSLILSLLPKRLTSVMGTLGYAGDRRKALELFERAGGWSKSKNLPAISAEQEGVRRPLCDMAILLYHLVIADHVPMTDVDLPFADKVLSWNLKRFPNGIFFLYFSARLYMSQALPEKAIDCYRNAIETQREFKQLHHLCFWSLSLTYLSISDYDRAYECYDVLSRESNWSKAVYQYAKAAILYETSEDNRAQGSVIMATVPRLVKKVAGRNIPHEQFVQAKALKFGRLGHCGLPVMEFAYIWHCFEQTPVFLLMSNQLSRIDEVIDELEAIESPCSFGTGEADFYSLYCLAFFLRGVALRYVAYPELHTMVRLPVGDHINVAEAVEDAIHSFQRVFEHANRLDSVDRYLVYFAHYELGCLYAAQGDEAQARRELELVLSRKPLTTQDAGPLRTGKANYLLSGICQLRCHAALETIRIRRDRQLTRSVTRSRTVRSQPNARRQSLSKHASISSSAGPDHTHIPSDIGHRARQSRLVV
ncbi:hypothetical protein MVES1_003511 [Malassezia vespertilionis]|uniref:CRAL-TRIO domain-containing protein n=1 Tax=Malassezia vespertilionis TaxID=2020962 RepID=A0A2N1J740_9BASI|nr:uncharacterized protein MVES1_003511 [Malassezia vespertilionis]PKI82360.1 hypothetical protein MVES_003748 [Malassezia vespertilionis]WFD08141.1 hypothetical protein MVES1_003511 [Malassezia vespertilionis]